MKLSKLIDRLVRIYSEKGDLDVTTMQETYMTAHLPIQTVKQVESEVRDLATSSDRVIIIGQELDD